MLRLKASFRSKVLLAAVTILIFAACAVLVWNTARLQREADAQTRRYVSGFSAQLAQAVDDRLAQNILVLGSISDSLLRIDASQPGELRSFIERKTETLGFSGLAVMGTDGRAYQFQCDVRDFSALPGVQDSLRGQNGVSFLEGQGILYSIPIYRDGRVEGVLGGLRAKENMQALIRAKSFSGMGLACIVDCAGNVVISPTDLMPFLQLDHIFVRDPHGEAAQDIRRMQADMQAHRAGVIRFQAVDGSDLILAYDPMESYDWVLLTLVPGNLISEGIDSYISQTSLIIIGVVLLMACVLLILIIGQRTHFKQMERAAFVDRVTGGMSNTAFQLRCERLIPKAAPNTYTIVLVNIKNFKLINQRFGSENGNEVLRRLCRRLERLAEGKGFAARADADNFYLCLEAGAPSQVEGFMDGLLREVEADVRQFNREQDTPLHFVLQPGAYIVEEPSLEITIMQDRAKAACRNRTASEDGVCKFFDKSIMERWGREQELNALFEDSLRRRDFQMYLQPKVWTADGKAGGAEALVRWVHPQKGLIFPMDFIPLFEANGKICKLDFYVFEEACKTLRRWMDAGEALLPISVNLSRQHFRQEGCIEHLAGIARRYGIPDGALELELTESIFFDDQGIERVKGCIREMHRLGFACSLDDFGSGYSSLGLLMDFDVDAIKLDRRFFKDMGNAKMRDLIASLLELARKIGVQTVAEGIETPEQLALLRELGCDLIQGYIYAKPLPVPDFEAWRRGNGP